MPVAFSRRNSIVLRFQPQPSFSEHLHTTKFVEMNAVLTLPPAFGFVALSAVGTWFVHHGVMASGVMAARKKFGVPYPTLYASEAECKDEKARNQYNCVQRAHQNSLENLPSFYALLLVCGLKYPITSSIAALFYMVGRFFYFKGYSTGEPNNRYQGSLMYIGLLGLLGTACKIAWDGISAYATGLRA